MQATEEGMADRSRPSAAVLPLTHGGGALYAPTEVYCSVTWELGESVGSVHHGTLCHP